MSRIAEFRDTNLHLLFQTPAEYELSLFRSPKTITLPNIPDGVRPEDFEELARLYRDMRRVLDAAASNGVRILIDAEHSWFQVRSDGVSRLARDDTDPAPCLQPAIDSFTAILSSEYNKLPIKGEVVPDIAPNFPAVQPLVYGTYQSYLRR